MSTNALKLEIMKLRRENRRLRERLKPLKKYESSFVVKCYSRKDIEKIIGFKIDTMTYSCVLKRLHESSKIQRVASITIRKQIRNAYSDYMDYSGESEEELGNIRVIYRKNANCDKENNMNKYIEDGDI